ncbi:MAG: DMT family transporter [Desulfobacterales bacterium]|jgi:drug/metabolite transporter (DMT)-like permease|nr:DMT family transporter [Desulfobacterales bacterium]
MTAFALTLLLCAGFVHAGWNYLAKKAGGGPVFVWLFASMSTLLYAPLAAGALWWSRPPIGLVEGGVMLVTALIHIAYFLLLQQGYKVGDLSLVYPLARGTGPVLSMVLAILLFHERPSAVAAAGGLLVAGGVFALAGGASGNGADRRPAVIYGLLTGSVIAMYTLWDKLAVSTYLIPPLILVWAIDAGRVLLLGPVALNRPSEVLRQWRERRKEIIAVGALCPLSYILVLTALVTTPVSYIAPAREVSILIGTVMGSRWLFEKEARRRIPAALAIVVGIIALAVG